MKKILQRLFSPKTRAVKKINQRLKEKHKPLIISFDGRVLRLNLPE